MDTPNQASYAVNLDLAYREKLDQDWLRISKIAALTALIMIPAGITLDYVVYPHLLGTFLSLRLVCDIIIGALFLSYATEIGRRHLRLISYLWLLSAQVMICYMIAATEDPISPYYAGLNLAMMAAGIILPTTAKETLFFCVSTLILYFLTFLTQLPGSDDFHLVYNNAYFLILTGAISVLSAYINSQRRFAEFRLTYELDKRNQEMAQLDRMKSDFFANISHELRTPLTLILSPVQDILERQTHLPDKLAETLATVRNNSLRLLKLVNDLLDVIRLEEGKAKLQQEPVLIDSLLRGIADSMIHLAQMQEVELSKSLKTQQTLVLGDQDALEKIFINLLNNAIKFTPEGGKISISSSILDDRIRITVSDTGIGIHENDLPYVFDRFRQADGSTTRRYQGTGLGLTLVKELTERHSGTVAISSALGEGTDMSVFLPIYHSDKTPTDTSNAPTKSDIGIQQLHRLAEINTGLTVASQPDWEMNRIELDPRNTQASVLVVDDETDMRNYLVESLREDFQVIYAKDGLEGLEMAQQHHPDLMLLDLMLPELDGLEVCQRLKQDKATRGIKIILLTARVDEDAKLTALKNGADDFLTKPFSSIEVRTRLNNLHLASSLERDLNDRNVELQDTLQDLRNTQGQLVQSEKLNALGNLSAGLLHEINNPLNYTMTALQIASFMPDVKNNTDLNEIVTDMTEGLGRIQTIVTDLRAFAYPEEAAKQQPFDIAKALEVALRFTANDLNNAEIEQTLAKEQKVLGSQSHIVQVLVNIFTNGAKAIAANDAPTQGHIKISSEVTGDRLTISISDNGVGMTEDVLARVFDPFFTTRDVGEGMGLGLSVCHTILKNHNGALTAKSKPGAGSTFYFDLELAEKSK